MKRALFALCCGLFWVGCTRERPTEETSKADNRADASPSARRPSDASPSPRRANPQKTAVPAYDVRPLAPGEHLRIDGRLDEPAWQTAGITQPFVHPGNGASLPEEAPLGGTARFRYDAEHLYVAIVAKDTTLRGGFPRDALDPHLWTRDTVELMIDPEGDGDNRDYYEIQVSPQGLVFDSQFDGYNQPRVLPDGPFGHQEWRSELKLAVTLQGTLDDASDLDEGYVVELALPFNALSKAKKRPPTAGDEWRVNVYVMQDNGGVSWSPILGEGNFHRASRFGRLRFR